MEPTTIRLPEDMARELAEEASEYGYSSRAEYIRHILRNRSGTDPTTPRSGSDTASNTARSGSATGSNTPRSGTGTDPNTDQLATLIDAVKDLADRVEDLENDTGMRVDLDDLKAADEDDQGNERNTTTTPTAGGDPGFETGAGSHGDHERDALYERAETVLADLDVPGVSERTETTRRKAILYAWAELRDRGTAESRELANAAFDAFDEDDLGYSSARRYRGYGLWDGCLRNALKQLPGVNSPPERGSQWRFDPDDVDESG